MMKIKMWWAAVSVMVFASFVPAFAQIADGRTMVPVRVVSESFGCSVDLDANTKTVMINSGLGNKDVNEVSEKVNSNEKYVYYPDWISELSEGVERPAPIADSIKDDSYIYDIHKMAKSSFVESALPLMLMNNEKLCLENMSDKEEFTDFLEYIWIKNFMYNSGYLYNMDSLYYDAGMKFKDNISLNIMDIENDSKAAVLAVSDDYNNSCIIFAAILYDKEKGFRVYTLKKISARDYYVCSATGGIFVMYPVNYIHDEEVWPFNNALISPKEFLRSVYLIEKDNIKPYGETE